MTDVFQNEAPKGDRNDFQLIKTLIWDPVELKRSVKSSPTLVRNCGHRTSFLGKNLLRHLRNTVIFNSATADLFREWAKVICSAAAHLQQVL